MAPINSFMGKFSETAFALSASTERNYHCMESRLPRSSMAINGVSHKTSSSPDISSISLSDMCQMFRATPTDLLYLSSQTGGERGVCIYSSVEKGDVILSIPISSCFRDDEPPKWFEGDDDGGDDHDINRYNPSGWASRLAAILLDHEFSNKNSADLLDSLEIGRETWKSMLPDRNILRASLPVHWSEEFLSNTKCTALELAVDSAYFARANAVMQLQEELKQALFEEENVDDDFLRQKCGDALDIVQTRTCRVERTCEDGAQWGPPLRILAPIFDFINHGSMRNPGTGGANAAFGVEGAKMSDMNNANLVVRAIRDIEEGEEILFDYGDSARPAWRCLSSYGFVPDFSASVETGDDDVAIENVAELWMNGLRFDVDPESVPYDLVEVAAAQALLDGESNDEDEEKYGLLTPGVARSIARRATDSAYRLLLEPGINASIDNEDEESPETIHSESLAASLRWSQYSVLLSFAENLERFSFQAQQNEAEKA